MSLDRRECLLHDEDLTDTGVKMEAFSNYSRPSCLLECRARHLFDECGCLPYYFPDFAPVWKKNTTCTLQGLKCIGGKTKQLNALKPEAGDKSSDFIEGADCNCPHDCEETVYSTDMSQADLRPDSLIFERLKKDYKPVKNLVQKIASLETNQTSARNRFLLWRLQDRLKELEGNTSLVHIYFKELGIIKYSKDELYGAMDVIAAFGGIVGLCMGFSLLSAAELIYFFTLRFWLDRQAKKKADQRAQQQSVMPSG